MRPGEPTQVSHTERPATHVTEIFSVGIANMGKPWSSARRARVPSRFAMEPSGLEQVSISVAELATQAAAAEKLPKCGSAIQCIVNDQPRGFRIRDRLRLGHRRIGSSRRWCSRPTHECAAQPSSSGHGHERHGRQSLTGDPLASESC